MATALSSPASLDLPPKGDAFDFIQKMPESDNRELNKNQWESILRVLNHATPIDGMEEFDQRLDDIGSGRGNIVPWPWTSLTKYTCALLPGTVTVLCGSPGSGKSFFLLQCLRYWEQIRIKACVFELEEDQHWHLQRLLAQIVGRAKLMDLEWIWHNITLAKTYLAEHRKLLSRYRSMIYTTTTFTETLSDLSKWVEERAEEGHRIICLDPISVASRSERPWEDDLEFVRSFSRTAAKHGCSIVLVTHPRLGPRSYTLNDMAGGASHQRLSQTVIWLVKEKKPRVVKVPSISQGSTERSVNRTVRLAKTRYGPGQDMEIGFLFNADTLRFEECGVIVSDVGE